MAISLKIIIVVLLLLIIGCVEEITIDEITSVPEEILDIGPMSVSLDANIINSTLQLRTAARCFVSGGEKPYIYSWKINDSSISLDCEDACDIEINKLGSFKVICEVTDKKNRTAQDSIILDVEKIKERIDAIITLGDSLIAGFGIMDRSMIWPELFTKDFEHATLYNYAISGATSYSVKDYQMQLYYNDLIEGNKLIFLWVGANDIARFITIEKFSANYISIISMIQSRTDSTLILMTIPDASKLPVAIDIERDVNFFMQQLGVNATIGVRTITKEIIRSYNQIIFNAASQYGLPVIDMFFFMESLGPDFITEDQFHPNAAGHRLIKQKIDDEMKVIFPYIEFI